MERNLNDGNRSYGASPRLVVILVLAVLLVVFTLQNQEKVSLRLFFWTVGPFPVALLIVVSLLLGYLIPFFTGLSRWWRSRWNSSPGGDISGGGRSRQDASEAGEEDDQEDPDEEEGQEEDDGERDSVRRPSPKPHPEGIAFDDDPGKEEPSFTRRFFRE